MSTYIVTNNGGGLDRLSDHARQTVDSEDEARRAMISMILADADYADEIGMHDLAEDLTAMAEDTNLAQFGADGTIVTIGSFAYSAQKVPAMTDHNATECECSEEYGPCEDHSEVLAQRECVWCGRVARCSDAGTGDAMCEDCWNRMEWIIPDGPLLEEDGDR